MSYQETIDYLFSRLPMFQRIGAAAYKADLTNTIEICKALANPETKFKSIHVAGTNGKGSSSHMLAAIFQKAGYKTGLYTSPHLIDFRERIKINGKLIPKKKVIDFVKNHKAVFEEIQPSFFEWTVGLAFDYFANEKVDIAIVEVGLGGRLDSTNVIHPEICLITNIGWDHMSLLGDTLPRIAGEKAGIIKNNVPVVISEFQKECAQVFLSKAKNAHSKIIFASDEMEAKEVKNDLRKLLIEVKNENKKHQYQLDLTGSYQLNNILGVLKVIDEMREKGWRLPGTKVKAALKNAAKISGLNGRWQVISKKPLTICDTGHNYDGMLKVLEGIRKLKFEKLHFVIGMVNDKEPDKILKLLPKNAIYYFTNASIPRAMPAAELALHAKKIGLNGRVFQSVKNAVKTANIDSKNNDLIFIGGSTFVVAEVI